MKFKRRALLSILWIVLGIGLNIACIVTEIDNFWGGLGSGFTAVGIFQLVRWVMYYRNEKYRETVDIENKDERNRYLSAKAWSWTGYLFVILCAVACIVLRILGLDTWSIAASGTVCLILVLYWVSYLILKRKY